MDIIFIQENTLFYHVPSTGNVHPHTIALDIDWTIAFGQTKLFPSDPDDIHLLPNRKELLTELYITGHNIALFTNQSAVSKKEIAKRISRITTLIKKLEIPCYAFIATGKDKPGNHVDLWRKPRPGMWEKFLQLTNKASTKNSLYIGDALGRPQDFSDSDLEFAKAAGLISHSPEYFFEPTVVKLGREPFTRSGSTQFPIDIGTCTKTIVLFVGMPGSGKSTYTNDILKPLGFVSVSRDELGSKAKVIKTARQHMKDYRLLAVDNTNPTQEDREIFYDLARELHYKVVVIYIVRDGRGWNNLRHKKVPTIAYHIYFKHLEPPTEENTPGELFLVA
jgi:bifunctional polynucleotide phosphatase/kinase